MKLKQKEIDALSSRIERSRLAKELTYSAIARETGVNQGQVSRICRGKFKTKSSNVMQICILLNVDAEDDESADVTRIKDAVMKLWDGTSADADRITRLLAAVSEVRRTS